MIKKRNIKQSKIKNIFRFPSIKMGEELDIHSCSQTLESSLEFNACYHLEYSPAVKSFEAQPIGFRYEFLGRLYIYTPDFKVIIFNNPTPLLIEIKPTNKLNKDDFIDKFRSKQLSAREKGMKLILYTEDEICRYPLLDNLMILHRYNTHKELTSNQISLLYKIKSLGKVTVEQAIQSCGLPDDLGFALIIKLLARHKLNSDINQNTVDRKLLIW